jgi:diacylglycerol kinase family enzyme
MWSIRPNIERQSTLRRVRLALVANPRSGGGVDPAELAAGLDADVVVVALGDPLPDGVERVVVAGGDGSIGPCAAACAVAGVPLAVVPVGTANDFAAFHGLPADTEAALRLAGTGTQLATLELARIDGRPFVNVASGGLSPVAAEKAKPLKGVLGPAAYAVGAVAAGATADPFHCLARVDGEAVFDGEAWQVIVASSGAFGGGAEVQEADPADGRLDLVAIPAGSRLALPSHAAAMRRGEIAAQDDVLHRTGREITLEVANPTQFNVDGEIITCTTGAAHFTVQPAAFQLIVG